jgi:hypothetical protein
MTFNGVLVSLLVLWAPLHASAQAPVAISKTDLNKRILLQVSYEHEAGRQDFMNTRSRIVEFERHGESLRMIE